MTARTKRSRVRVGAPVAMDNPLLRLRLSTTRSRLVFWLIVASFALLAGRAVYLQLHKNTDLQQFGARSYSLEMPLAASRGKILDRNQVVLASSLPARGIFIDPQLFHPVSSDQIVALAAELDMAPAVIRRRATRDSRYASLKRQVDIDLAERILAMKIPGVGAQREYKRHYPEGQIAAHIVGFTDYDDVGREGIEKSSDMRLKGQVGSRRVIRDRYGRIIDDDSQVKIEPVNGDDEQLSIDSRLQFLTFNSLRDEVKKLKAKSGAAIAINVQTGEILALANYPSFNPNDRSNVSMDSVRNRAVYDSFEPGSTMKPFTIALALELRKVTPSTIIETAPGKLKIGPDTIGDSHFLGALTVEEVVQKSSNVGTAKIALDMQAQQMWEFLTALGFGSSPNAGFPGAVAGRVRPHRKWRPVEQATISYGHGLSVSLLQLAHAYMVFARDGDIAPLTIRRRETPVAGRRLISSQTAMQVRRMLELAASPEGTAPKAQVVGYRVAGKTGTSLKQEHGKYVKKYVSSFVGFVPASAPQVLIAVTVDEPSGKLYYASDVAAPLFSRIASDALRQLRIAPDSAVAEIVVPGTEEEVVRR